MNKRLPKDYSWTDKYVVPGRFSAQPAEPGLQDQVSQAASDSLRKVGEFIGNHPAACLAAAVTCGVIIGWLAKRKL